MKILIILTFNTNKNRTSDLVPVNWITQRKTKKKRENIMTVKKFIALTSAAVAAVALTASAQVAVDVNSAYIFRGATINDDVNVQPGFDTVIFGESTTVGTWANFNTDSSEFDEIDYFFGVTIPTGEESPIAIEVGYTEYTYPGSETEADREPYISFAAADLPVDLSIGFFYGIDGGIKDSLYIALDLGYGVDVAENVALGLGATVGYSDPDQGDSGFSHITLVAGLDVGIPESDYSVTFGVAYVIETDSKVLEVDEDFYFTVGTTLL
ncbi:TorF family putative porin [Kiritimatiellota bacterium B12222]|nr:TorF family putative porin [Kiritimatiellota bacterium B12222]